MFSKITLAFFIIALAETTNGIFRIRFLNKRLKKRVSKVVSFFIGLIIIISLNILLVPWIDPKSEINAFLIGVIFATGMVLYDVAIGRLAFKMSWQRIFEDFNLLKGNLLTLGILVLLFLPYIVFLLLLK